jgi:hypothetical protein
VDTKIALMQTPVGRRVIAFLTIFGSGDFDRLRTYIAENYNDTALRQCPVDERLHQHQTIFEQAGKLRVYQVVASDEHHVVFIVQGQKDDSLYLNEMRIEADYPHKVIEFTQTALQEDE